MAILYIIFNKISKQTTGPTDYAEVQNSVCKLMKVKKMVIFDHNWGDGVRLNHTLIAKLHVFKEHYIHLLLYSICSFTSINVTFINL